MSFDETIAYLYERLPVFHRIGPKALKPGLANTRQLVAALGNPQDTFPAIHVAGTNGKGSTSHMLASIYAEAGYKVGLYTSPHLYSFTERIRINGVPIPEDEVVRFVEETKELVTTVAPSFFELTVALAFDYFARERVDLAVIEVGLGGLLDSTNIITPRLSLITNIGYDHMDVLGDTLPLIAAQKAGIIKPRIPAVVGEWLPETKPVFERVAAEQNAPLFLAGDRFNVVDEGLREGRRSVLVADALNPAPMRRYELDLLGVYQLKNLPAVLQTVALLQPEFPVSEASLGGGLARIVSNSGLQGRFQIVRKQPYVVLDTAHNAAGIREVLRAVNEIPHCGLRIVLGIVADKKPDLLLAELPANAVYYLCKAATPRSMSVAELASYFRSKELIYREFNNVNEALREAIHQSKECGMILVTGSNYLVAEVNYLTS